MSREPPVSTFEALGLQEHPHVWHPPCGFHLGLNSCPHICQAAEPPPRSPILKRNHVTSCIFFHLHTLGRVKWPGWSSQGSGGKRPEIDFILSPPSVHLRVRSGNDREPEAPDIYITFNQAFSHPDPSASLLTQFNFPTVIRLRQRIFPFGWSQVFYSCSHNPSYHELNRVPFKNVMCTLWEN